MTKLPFQITNIKNIFKNNPTKEPLVKSRWGKKWDIKNLIKFQMLVKKALTHPLSMPGVHAAWGLSFFIPVCTMFAITNLTMTLPASRKGWQADVLC